MEPRLNNNLTAYRKKNSCETSLVKLVEDWKLTLDNKHVVGILSTDLSKAFDSLHPPLLLAKVVGLWFLGKCDRHDEVLLHRKKKQGEDDIRSGFE